MDGDVDFTPVSHFKPKLEKVAAAIGFLINEAERLGHELSQYDIVKSIFVADKRHLETSGRPVTYDNYIAMQHGPVGDIAIRMLASKFAWGRINLDKAPWLRSQGENKKATFSQLSAACDLDELSGSDEDALAAALMEVKAAGFTEVRRSSHRNPAYQSAWANRASQPGATRPVNAAPMDWRLIPEPRNDELIAELAMHSQAAH